MRREIKFKVWNIQQNAFINLGESFTPYNWLANSFNETNLVFLQFTGFKDKTGREIYEGDILKTEVRQTMGSYIANGEVIFADGKFNLDTEKFYRGVFDYLPLGFFSSSEIVGNVYQNADLLSAGKIDA